MIRLEVEDYCQNCPAFEPEVEHTNIVDSAFNIQIIETTVTCENKRVCKNLVRYLKKQLEKVGDTDGDHR